MRAISNELLTAQRAQANTPYVRIQFSKPDGSDIDTYATDDGTNRIIRVRASEELYGGALFEVSGASGLPIPIACQIILNNSDNVVSAIDYRGYKAMVGWGFESYVDGAGDTQAIASTKYSEGEPFAIFSQREHTSPGVNVTELWGISQWYMLEFRKIMGASLGDVYRNTDGLVRHLLIDSVTSDPDKVWMYDNSTTTYFDETADAGDDVTTFLGLVDSGDILFIGDGNIFDRVTLEITTLAAWNGSHRYEYWNGSAWIALSDVVDGSSNWENFGIFTVSFTMPSNWAKRTVNSSEQYYIRAFPIWSGRTRDADIRRVGISNGMGMQLGTSDSKENAISPNYAATQETSRREIVREMLDHTFSAFVARNKYFWLDQLNTNVDYSFDIDGDHGFYSDVRERTVVVPNAITAVNVLNDGGSQVTQYTASTRHTSNVFHDDVMEIIADDTITSDYDAGQRVGNRLNRYLEETYQGEISVPMQISLEPWDWVETVDDRLSLTLTGRLGRIIREFDSRLGVYRAQISMGNNKALPPELQMPPDSAATKALQKIIQNRFAESTQKLRLDTQEREDLGFNIENNTKHPADRSMEADQSLETFDFSSYSKSEPEIVSSPDPKRDNAHFADRFSKWDNQNRLRNSVNQLQNFSNASNFTSPSEAVEGGLSFWKGLPRSESSGYSSAKYATYSGSSGLFSRDLVTNILRFRDFQAGGYNDVLMYNGGNGTFYIEEIGSGSAVTNYDLKGDLLPNADSIYDLGSAAKVWADIYGDAINTARLNLIGGGANMVVASGLEPATDSLYTSGSSAKRWLTVYADTVDTATLVNTGGAGISVNESPFHPSGDNTIQFGTTSLRWSAVIAVIGQFNFLQAPGTGTEIEAADHLVPDTDGGYDLGTTSKRWGSLHVDDIQHEGANLGFFGTTPIAQETGIAVTAAGIHAALVNYGLITGP